MAEFKLPDNVKVTFHDTPAPDPYAHEWIAAAVRAEIETEHRQIEVAFERALRAQEPGYARRLHIVRYTRPTSTGFPMFCWGIASSIGDQQ